MTYAVRTPGLGTRAGSRASVRQEHHPDHEVDVKGIDSGGAAVAVSIGCRPRRTVRAPTSALSFTPRRGGAVSRKSAGVVGGNDFPPR